jgi:hypothetical protein
MSEEKWSPWMYLSRLRFLETEAGPVLQQCMQRQDMNHDRDKAPAIEFEWRDIPTVAESEKNG